MVLRHKHDTIQGRQVPTKSVLANTEGNECQIQFCKHFTNFIENNLLEMLTILNLPTI